MVFTADEQYNLAFVIRSLIIDEQTQEDIIAKLFAGTLTQEERLTLLQHMDKRKQDLEHWIDDCDEVTQHMLPAMIKMFQDTITLLTSA